MLGIGYIIAHFVAMQKPQQRKYHSSCNRSVHRGTAHGKQEVKVCKRKTPHLLVRSFLSPCGDGTYYVPQFANLGEFSPPYGDGTKKEVRVMTIECFRPLTGMILPWTPWSSQFRSFRPLTGIVQTGSFTGSAHCSFRPLTGMVLSNGADFFCAILFSPPYGENPLSHGLRRASSPERGA